MNTIAIALNGMITMMLAKLILNDMPHALGMDVANPIKERPTWYIKSKPPKEPYLYHHALYSGLKRIATRWAIEAPSNKQIVSLTTDAGRYLSPLPILAAITIDGVVKMPLTDELRDIAIPSLYVTHEQELVDKARSSSFEVYEEGQLPPEYKYIMSFIVHHQMFVNENEYTVIAKWVNLPPESIIYVHPAKLKRFKAGLPMYSIQDIRSLEELAR